MTRDLLFCGAVDFPLKDLRMRQSSQEAFLGASAGDADSLTWTRRIRFMLSALMDKDA